MGKNGETRHGPMSSRKTTPFTLVRARALLENSSQLVKSFVATVKHAFSLSSLAASLVAFLFCLTARVPAIGATVTLTFQPHRGTRWL